MNMKIGGGVLQKRILLIGAGIGQVVLAHKIKERGHYLITVTQKGNFPVIDIADKVCYENVFNLDAVLEIAKQERVDAVVSDQNDLMMPTVAYVAEHLGLPGNTFDQLQNYCDKNRFRENCDRLDIKVPRHAAVHSEEEMPLLGIAFPWMVKPADSQSSVGVCRVDNEDEYRAAVKEALRLSLHKEAIVEQFVKGREMVAEGFIYKGRYYNLGYADRKYFDLNALFIPSKTLFPSDATESVKRRIFDAEQKMAADIKPSFAIVHSEYLYDENADEVYVVESALRGGGVYISSHLVPLYTGIDVNELYLDCALGREKNVEDCLSQIEPKASGYVCFFLPEGEVVSVEGVETVKEMPWVAKADIDNIKVGDRPQRVTHKGQRLGPIIVSGKDKEDLLDHIKTIQDALKIEVINPSGQLAGINWGE